MASINTIVKRKQYLWLGIVVVGTASAIGGALYLSDVDMSGNGETVAEQEPVPDMTGVVDTTFDDKVRQHATTEMQVTAAQMQKQYEEIRRELNVLNKQRGDDQRRIEKLGQDNAALAEQVKALGANPVTATGEPVPQMPASPPGPEGEPQPGNTPVSFPPQGSVAVPPPTAFYPGNGVTPPPQVTYQSVPVPNRIQRKVFTRNEGKQGPSLPYIPSGSFAKAMLIEGADANASVTGNESTVPMQLRITGLVEMPNSKTYDATGCFVGLEAWGDVSSERAIVRTRNISCLKDGKTIDMPIKGHVSFRGKNGIKGEVVMRNGKILGWAWGAGFVDGIGQGMERASQPAVGLGATAAYGAGDVLKMGIGGGASKAAQTLSDYYIKRAEQYHPVIPIGAGNEVTVVFQDGFQLKTVEEMALERTQSRAEEDNPESPVAERRRAMAWSFVQEQVQPGVDNTWRESRRDIGKGMESVPSGGGSQDIIADHQGHQAIIEQRTQDSNIRNDVKHQVDNMVTEYRGNIGDTQNSIRGEENIVKGQYSELQNHHKTEALTQNNKYNEEKLAQERIPGADSPKELLEKAKSYQHKE